MIPWFRLFRARVSLTAGTDAEGTVERVSAGASLTAENLWLLVCSAVLASIGLDVSSTAVIIGAMLISPLMGPILGVGLGMGVTDQHLLKRSLKELAFATVFCLAASGLYFTLSPLATATPELIARTRPTLLDVGVAFFGGIAGIVAGSRRDQSLALPGVAIATALMPPLCTAGYGLATGEWAFFFGAFYLYLLNCVFIALATLLVVRFLRFPHHQETSDHARRRERQVVSAVAVVAILPSLYFLYDAVRVVREEARITSFVQSEIERADRAVPQWEHRHDSDDDLLKVYIAGHPVEPAELESLQAALPRYRLGRLRLELVQSDVSGADLTRLEGEVQRGILRAVSAATTSRDSAAASRARQDSLRRVSLARELASAFPEIQAVTWTPRLDLLAPDSVRTPPAYLLTFAPVTPAAVRRDILGRVQALVAVRLGPDSAVVLER